jgi:uncharacterized protein (TIGR00297 family)
MLFSDIAVLIFLVSGGLASVFLHKLTWLAAAAGILAGCCIYKTCGYTGIAMLAAFFVLGTAASGWQAKQKQLAGIAEENKGRRTAGQVIANAGVAGICGLIALQIPQKAAVLQLMMAGSFSAATADTLSSELGNIYGRRYYNILSFKKDRRGLNGVVSLEGTLCGIAGSVIIAIVYAIGFGWNKTFLWIILAGTVGNGADSVLGATLERRGYLGNNAVNFLNTLTGAMVCLLFS